MKKMKQNSGTWSFSMDPMLPTSGEDKFELYLKTHQIRQVSEVLRDVVSRDKLARKQWFEENADLMSQMMETFMENSFGLIDGLQMDNEAMQLSTEFVTNLREIGSILQSLHSEVDQQNIG